MAKFTVNASRIDPYKNFKFKVMWDGKYIAGISKISALKRSTEVIEQREGGESSSLHKSPGQTKYDPIILERGITHDNEFEEWANKVSQLGFEISLKDYRKNITIEMHNEAGQKVLAYNVYRCWVSEYQALPEIDAGSNAVAIEYIVLEHEGWERDIEVKEPEELSR